MLAGKPTSPPLVVTGGDNFSTFITELTVAVIYFLALAVAMMELELIFVDLFFLPALFSFAAILFGLEINMDFIVLDNLFHSSGE